MWTQIINNINNTCYVLLFCYQDGSLVNQEHVSHHDLHVGAGVDAQQSKGFLDVYNEGDKKALSFSYSLGYTENHMNINFWKKILCENTPTQERGWLDDDVSNPTCILDCKIELNG